MSNYDNFSIDVVSFTSRVLILGSCFSIHTLEKIGIWIGYWITLSAHVMIGCNVVLEGREVDSRYEWNREKFNLKVFRAYDSVYNTSIRTPKQGRKKKTGKKVRKKRLPKWSVNFNNGNVFA